MAILLSVLLFLGETVRVYTYILFTCFYKYLSKADSIRIDKCGCIVLHCISPQRGAVEACRNQS